MRGTAGEVLVWMALGYLAVIIAYPSVARWRRRRRRVH